MPRALGVQHRRAPGQAMHGDNVAGVAQLGGHSAMVRHIAMEPRATGGNGRALQRSASEKANIISGREVWRPE